ncbi:hypothetical protein RSal33209_1831 [Renibacterium salmoninarum ATCC 33209]|uniref:SnoaL-like domain-containing protein n=1 Tax=Renibacterium salmoninarum (strain ATCC 33209 / DSM 20767 / JCM 11484 / NBRC 15589 / NCIMB 2235) TaxID=288705 RepID=A9WN42_RENSM|nr:hypothetical protein [Renibacterium salmoninarum]ABY23564.1 hypothetical protein RSal33209_1831 [Renibacterium salmoninarum ATCC 33209]
MLNKLSSNAPETLNSYYRILQGGATDYQGGSRMRELLTEQLDFTGALAGHLQNTTEGFLRGVAGFISTVQQLEIIQDVHDDAGSAVLYTATMPGGPMMFAEFFTFENERIATLRLHYNGPEYLEKGGR